MIRLIEFLAGHFDKLLLTGIFIALVLLVLHMSHDAADVSAVNWARESAGTVLGALLGLITGALLRNGSKDNPPDGRD